MNDSSNEHCATQPVAVAVITPSGIFPNEQDYRRAYSGEPLRTILEETAKHLRLTNTSDWEAFVDNRPVEASKTFAENDLRGVVEVEWHKREGGGGCTNLSQN
jgi:hypothetical protein